MIKFELSEDDKAEIAAASAAVGEAGRRICDAIAAAQPKMAKLGNDLGALLALPDRER